MTISGNDPRIHQAVAILETGSPRQDSTNDQLVDVMALATAAGCYDAIDLIRRALNGN
jgi:hypothetical protein